MTEPEYNHLDIYTLLYSGNTEAAIRTFCEKTTRFCFTPFSRNRYLSSLNFGIYNYILLKEQISLHDCCQENEKQIAQYTQDSMIDIGIRIITNYGTDNRYLIEKYKNVHVRRAIVCIHEHLSEPLTLDYVSRKICINKAYLCQLFQKETGTGFCSYVLQQRMKLAERLLLHTADPIQEIALKCGYPNAAYFSTCYKKYMGCKPSVERRQGRT